MISIVSGDVQGIPVVYLSGEFEAADTEAFRRYVFDLAEQLPGNRMVIDLAQLDRACSGAVRVLVLVQRKLSILEGRLVVAGVNGLVREYLSLTQTDQLLDIEPNAEIAVSRLDRG